MATTLVSRPIDFASPAPKCRPVSNTSDAQAGPVARGSVWEPPAAGIIPRSVSGMANTVSSAAMRKSHRSAISTPDPMQNPCTAATTGLSKFNICPQTSRCHRTRRAIASDGAAPNSVRSAPAQKPRPSPVTSRARTSGSSATAASASEKSSLIWIL